MKSPEESFRGYLHREVDNAGKRFERARERVLVLSGGPEIDPGPALLEATEVLSAAMHVYVSALRRLAHYAAHKARSMQQKELSVHA